MPSTKASPLAVSFRKYAPAARLAGNRLEQHRNLQLCPLAARGDEKQVGNLMPQPARARKPNTADLSGMLNLNDFQLFVQIVEHGGFAAASRALHLSKSTLSYRVQALEQTLGARLLNRSTRQFGLTDAGQAFHAQAREMVRSALAAEAAVRSRTLEPSGLVRYTAAVTEAQFAMRPVLGEFLERYPKVRLFEHATDREVDLFAEGFDLAIRAHPRPLPDSGLIQRVLGTAEWHLLASPAYLTAADPILMPADLAFHPALFTRRAEASRAWRLVRDSKEEAVTAEPRVVSDSMAGLKDMAKAGLGLLALPAYVCREEVATGQLVRVLPEWSAGQSTLSALIPESRGLLPAVRMLLDHLAVAIPRAIQP